MLFYEVLKWLKESLDIIYFVMQENQNHDDRTWKVWIIFISNL